MVGWSACGDLAEGSTSHCSLCAAPGDKVLHPSFTLLMKWADPEISYRLGGCPFHSRSWRGCATNHTCTPVVCTGQGEEGPGA